MKFSRKKRKIIGGALLFLWVVFVLVFARTAKPKFMQEGLDFNLYYSIGELLKSNYSNLQYFSGDQAPPYLYSPLVTPFFYFWSLVYFEKMKEIFLYSNIFAFFIFPVFLVGEKKMKQFFFALLVSIILSPIIFEITYVGNINLFLLLLISYAIYQISQDRIFLSSILITLIAFFKPQYSLFILPCFIRSWKSTVAGGLLSTVSLLSISIYFYHLDLLMRLVDNWLAIISSPIATSRDTGNVSFNALLERWLTACPFNYPIGDRKFINVFTFTGDEIKKIIIGLKIMFLLGIFWIVFKKELYLQSKNSYIKTMLSFSLISISTLIFTPVIWSTHCLMLIFPLFYIAVATNRKYKFLSYAFLGICGLIIYFSNNYYHSDANRMNLFRAYGLLQIINLSLIPYIYFFCQKGNGTKQ